MEVRNLLPYAGSASELLPARVLGRSIKLEQLPSQRHGFIRTIRNHHQLDELLETSILLIRNSHEVNVTQLDRCGRGWPDLCKKFGSFLQQLEFCLANVFLEDHDLVALEVQGSEPGTTASCILEAIALTELVCCAEIDDRSNSVDLDAAGKSAATRQVETKVTATVTPVRIYKRHSLFPVVETQRAGQRIKRVHGKDSAAFPRLRRLFLIRRGRRLCAQPLMGAESHEHHDCDEENAFHNLRCLTVKSKIHMLPFSLVFALTGETPP